MFSQKKKKKSILENRETETPKSSAVAGTSLARCSTGAEPRVLKTGGARMLCG